MAEVRLAAPLQYDSIVDGPGVRMVLWTQGCTHHCPGCHNPHTHDMSGGMSCSIDACIDEIEKAQLQSGLTLSGGEPFLQAEALIPIAQAAKQKGLNLWAYSGFTFEALCQDPQKKALLMLLDVLVDGRFEQSQKDYRLQFKGSKNQRIIDVQESLRQGKVIASCYDNKNRQLEEL